MRKNIFLFSTLAAVLMIVSCSKNEDSNVSIVGTWRAEESVTVHYVDGEFYDSQVVKPNGELNIEFRQDGSLTLMEKDGATISTTSGTYMVAVNALIMNINKLGIDDKIVVESQSMVIESLTGSSLILSSEQSETRGGKVHKYIGNSSFKRVI